VGDDLSDAAVESMGHHVEAEPDDVSAVGGGRCGQGILEPLHNPVATAAMIRNIEGHNG